MSEFDYVDKNFISTHKFAAVAEETDNQNISFRLKPNGAGLPIPMDDLKNKLCKELSKIIATKFDNYRQVESRCYINEYTMRSYINGKRSIPIYAVGKLCVDDLYDTCAKFKIDHLLDKMSRSS